MADPLKPPTHKAFAFRREGKKMRFGRWLEIGTGRADKDGTFHTRWSQDGKEVST